MYINAIHYSVRNNGIICKLAAYVILGINNDEYKEVLTIEVGENESFKYWISVLNGLKNWGVKNILMIYAYGLTNIKEIYRLCISKDGISILYRPSNQKHHEVCSKQRP